MTIGISRHLSLLASIIVVGRSDTVRLGLIADTHGHPLPESVRRLFAGVDLILHAGDLGSEQILTELAAIAPVEAVAGNIDSPALLERLGWRKIVLAGSTRIGLVHGDRGSERTTVERALGAFEAGSVDVVVFGHSHAPRVDWHRDVLLVNPGSATVPRLQPRPSVALLTVGAAIDAEIVWLPRYRISPR
ncbi:MAG: metallophosphoesterase [Chloroflexota bacterium]|nr:metallophosphoesterase [Dehalococcoidia bacterium]MDW8253038.1 metallophosphoesterase [Chloroflexota bacterium]